jgi:hypothetical protein
MIRTGDQRGSRVHLGQEPYIALAPLYDSLTAAGSCVTESLRHPTITFRDGRPRRMVMPITLREREAANGEIRVGNSNSCRGWVRTLHLYPRRIPLPRSGQFRRRSA